MLLTNQKNLEDQLQELEQSLEGCTSCGICSESCTTFQLTGWEHQSPRGRIQLAQAWIHGRIDPSTEALKTFDDCIGCQSCERSCPLSVDYPSIRKSIQQLRLELVPSSSSSVTRLSYLNWIKAAYRIGSPYWRKYGWKWLDFPWLPLTRKKSYLKSKKHFKKGINPLVLVVSCVQDLFCHQTIEAAIDILHKLGYSVFLSANQACCGAMFDRLAYGRHETNSYQKEHTKAVHYQKKRTEAFLRLFSSTTCFLSYHCQCHLFSKIKDPFLIKDLYGMILEEIKNKQISLRLKEKQTAYYQPYCRLGKEIAQDFAWQLLGQIENLTIRLIPNSSSCCGGYGYQTAFYPEQAWFLLQPKLNRVPAGSTILVTSPDCQGQFLLSKTHKDFKIMHVIDFILTLFV